MNFKRRPATLNDRIDQFGTYIWIQWTKLHQNQALVEKNVFGRFWISVISYHPTYTITVNTQEMLLWIPEPDMVHESGNGILLIVLFQV